MSETDRPAWLITGAAGALGRELVWLLIENGCEVIAVDRDSAGLDKLHDELLVETSRAPLLMPLDLAGAGPDDYHRLAEAVAEQFQGLDGLVHNAMAFRALRPLLHQPADEWIDILQTGLTGPWLLTCALMPLLRVRRHSVIAFVSDETCLEKPANWGAYGIAQAGRRQMVKTLCAESGGRGPRIIEIDPGPFYSALRTAAWPSDSPDNVPPPRQAAEGVLERLGVAG